MIKLIVVTGGTKGIGKAVIRKFAENGFAIATCSRNEEDFNAMKEEIHKDFPGSKLYYRETDISKKNECYNFIDFVKGLGYHPEILVNNAGIFLPGQIINEEDETLDLMLKTNLYSSYYFARAFGNIMKEKRKGHIFNICSTASIIAYTNGGSYCISKFALYGMSKVLREELKEYDVKVTAVLPGATHTASWEGVDLPEERFMKSEDVAESVYSAYTLSSRSVVEEILIRPQLGDL